MARSVLGVATWEQIEAAAVEALQDGLESHSLRLLAGLDAAHASEAEGLLTKVFEELDLEIPKPHDAVFALSESVAAEIVKGEVAPYDGAEEIARLSRIPVDPVRDLDPFVYVEDEWLDRPEDREFFDNEIVKAARRFLDRREPLQK